MSSIEKKMFFKKNKLCQCIFQKTKNQNIDILNLNTVLLQDIKTKNQKKIHLIK